MASQTARLQQWARDHPSVMGFALSGTSVATGVVLTNWVGALRGSQGLG